VGYVSKVGYISKVGYYQQIVLLISGYDILHVRTFYMCMCIHITTLSKQNLFTDLIGREVTDVSGQLVVTTQNSNLQ